MTWTTVCRTGDVEEEYPYSAKIDGKHIGVYELDGHYYALDDVCPHAFALLSQGFVEDGEVECPLHEAIFDIRTGKCLGPPADQDLKVYPLRVEDDEIQLNVSEG